MREWSKFHEYYRSKKSIRIHSANEVGGEYETVHGLAIFRSAGSKPDPAGQGAQLCNPVALLNPYFCQYISNITSLKMLKRTKKITLIFIWLTGLMFFAHGITPHHHHFDSVLEHQDTAVPDNHHEDNPVHCHAFNDLVIDKSEVTSVNNQIPESFTATVFGNNLNRLITENSGKKTDTALQDKIPPEAVLLKNTPTRGSPTPA